MKGVITMKFIKVPDAKNKPMLINLEEVAYIKTEVWLSLVERFVRDEEAVGSNPVTPTR